MTTQNFIDMYGLLLGENAGPVKKMMMVHAAYMGARSIRMIDPFRRPHRNEMPHILEKSGYSKEEIKYALQIFDKEMEEKVL